MRGYVGENGQLREELVLHRQLLYKGRNGKSVERIWARGEEGVVRFIYKPLTNETNAGKEGWAHRHLLPRLPNVRSPRLLAAADHMDAERYWMIFEDAGPLQHEFTPEVLMRAAALIPYWHRLPVHTVPETFGGHTPPLAQVWEEVMSASERICRLLDNANGSDRAAPYLLDKFLREDPAAFSGELAVCHGDFSPMNIALQNEELILLDWEYVHRNSMYWDLYNLIDMTSPHYRRGTVMNDRRAAILQEYANQRQKLGIPLDSGFMEGYFRYSLTYSLWVLLRIQADLENGRFDPDELSKQKDETLLIVNALTDYLHKERH